MSTRQSTLSLKRNYKFRLYPNQQQEEILVNNINVCRWVYNKFIEYGDASKFNLDQYLTELKEQEPWLYNHNAKMLQQVSTQISGARSGLKQLKENGRKTGELRFARYGEYRTITYNQSGFKIENNKLSLSKIGSIKMKQHRGIIGDIKQITITKTVSGKWFAIVSGEIYRCNKPIVDMKKSVGLDVGIENFVYDSNGFVTPNPHFLNKLEKKKSRIQRVMSRRKFNSNNYQKARKWYQIIHERIANRRKDFHHKLSNTYAKKYDVVCIEKLQIPNMVRCHQLAKSIMDVGWAGFTTKLAYKSKLLLKCNPVNTSQDCSRCGTRVQKTLAIRIHHCNVCGLKIHRDHNSAIEIKNKCIPQELRELKPVEISMRSMKQEAHDFSRG